MSLGQDTEGTAGDELPLREGAIYGAAAYVVGYILTYVLVSLDGEADLGQLGGTDIVSPYQVVGWVFYAAHFVDTEFTGLGMSESANLLSEGTYQFPTLLYYAIPIVALVGAGYLLADNLGLDDAESGDAARAGAMVAAGYLPLAAVGAFVFTVEESQSAMGQTVTISMGPPTTTAIVLAGIVFPVVLGAIGGLLRSET